MRERIDFDGNWLFHKGDIIYDKPKDKGYYYMQAKTERYRTGPASRFYFDAPDSYASDRELNTTKWERITLPHDYIISQTPDKDNNCALGFFKYENAWYRKRFTLDESDKNKRICLYFEGIATEATVYLNGCLITRNTCGYTEFEADITDYVYFDSENVLAVYVETDKTEEWWYAGGGIYRHVYLEKTEKTAVDRFGVYVKTKKCGDEWNIQVENTVRNDGDRVSTVTAVTDIYCGEKSVLSWREDVSVNPRSENKITFSSNISSPHLWDIDDPFLYQAVTALYCGNEKIDEYKTSFGFRDFYLDANKGAFLNGKRIKIKGVCAHQDFGLTGKAVSDNIQKHKIALIKEMGANGFRCSHYPHSNATMDALDELGLITMAETRWFSSTPDGLKQLEMLIKRDRNRPSVCFWSIGNEEFFHITDNGRRINATMLSFVKKLDSTRIITCAVDKSPLDGTVYDGLDAIGINYNLQNLDPLHEKYPNAPIFSSECCATGTTRGWYFDDFPQKGYLNAKDKDTNAWFLGREKTWKFVSEREWLAGYYQWIAFEHRGEAVWPRLCSQSGAIDLFLQKKDAFYQNQSHWIEDKPILHLLPHWNWCGLEGEIIDVWVYTNCAFCSLSVNGKSYGKVQIEKFSHAHWEVPFEKGEITAIGYDENGNEIIRETRKTSGVPYALKLKAENKVTPNGKDILLVTCYCVDENNVEVPDASPFVRFSSNKLGSIVGTGSSVSDHSPVTETDRQMYAGRISVAVKVGSDTGTLKVYAQGNGLNSAVLSVELK